MAQICKKTVNNVILRVFIVFISLIILSLFLEPGTLTFVWAENKQGNETLSAKPFSTLQNSCGQEEAFAFIPAATVSKWAQTEFLIVFGTLSVDNDGRRRRRALQRATCWTFPGVATRANAYNGSLLVLYALARHPAHGFAFSESLRLEAAQWHDIINLPMIEGQLTTEEKMGIEKNLLDEAKYAMSKKIFFWLQLALRAFPLAVHIGKCDDDMFINVPHCLAELRLLPQHGTYWGPYTGGITFKSKQIENVDVKFMVGFAVALDRNVTEEILS